MWHYCSPSIIAERSLSLLKAGFFKAGATAEALLLCMVPVLLSRDNDNASYVTKETLPLLRADFCEKQMHCFTSLLPMPLPLLRDCGHLRWISSKGNMPSEVLLLYVVILSPPLLPGLTLLPLMKYHYYWSVIGINQLLQTFYS